MEVSLHSYLNNFIIIVFVQLLLRLPITGLLEIKLFSDLIGNRRHLL
jgi:hypothetical protein